MKKILAVLLALAMLLGFAACGGNNEDATTTTEATTEDIFAEVDDTTVADEATTAADEATTIADEATTVADEATTVAGETTTAAAEEATTVAGETTAAATTAATTKAANAMPQTKEEIVAAFNKAVNGVKANAKKVTHHYSKISLNGATKLPGWADTLLKLFGGADKFINDQLVSNSKGEQVYTGADIKNKLPVENESYASKLTAADVKDAKIVEKNGQWVIRVTTIADAKSSTVKHGEGHAPKAFNVVLPGVVNDALGKIPGATNLVGGEAEMDYPSSTATIYVDIATGNVVKAEYDLKWTINFGTEVVIPFTTLDSYTINY